MKRSNALVVLGSVLSILSATPVLAAPKYHQHHSRQETHLTRHTKAAQRAAPSAVIERARGAYTAQGSTGGEYSPVLADARRYLGTNPTGRRSLWCGAFVDKVLRDTGHRGGGDLAKGYLHYGPRFSRPRIGAIAVLSRPGKDTSGRRGGHVGFVAGIDPNGNPILISGDHNGTTAEAAYPQGRVIAYVMPQN